MSTLADMLLGRRVTLPDGATHYAKHLVYQRAYYERHRSLVLERSRERYEANRPAIRARAMERYYTVPGVKERYNELSRRWNAENPDRIALARKRFQAKVARARRQATAARIKLYDRNGQPPELLAQWRASEDIDDRRAARAIRKRQRETGA